MAARQLAVVGTIFWIIERRYNPDFLGHARRWGSGVWPPEREAQGRRGGGRV